jgi:hypothetical protein
LCARLLLAGKWGIAERALCTIPCRITAVNEGPKHGKEVLKRKAEKAVEKEVMKDVAKAIKKAVSGKDVKRAIKTAVKKAAKKAAKSAPAKKSSAAHARKSFGPGPGR